MSCIRFELDNLDNCKKIGEHYADPKFKRNYYGLGCISVFNIKNNKNISIKFTPITKLPIKNYFHCDVYDEYMQKVENGSALDPKYNEMISDFKKKWAVHEHIINITKEQIMYK
jgi:hypothetical protein